MSTNVGTIYYAVEADTAKLINSTEPLNQSLDGLNKRFGKTDKAANDASMQLTKTAAAVKSLGKETDATSAMMAKLGKYIGGYLTFQGVSGLIQMAEGYNEMAERIGMATSSAAEYDMVQKRLLETANATYRPMAEAQELYILTADSLRSMGYSTSQAVDVTDSMSYAFVKNATSAQRAASAVSAFTKSIQTGKVGADSWSSIIAAIPSVIDDIAKAAGLTAAEVRKLGASGELAAKQLNEGLRQSLEENKAASAGMATTVKDAFTSLRNNLAAYVGEANRASGATGVLSSAILGVSGNIDTIVKLLMTAGSVALARYIAQMGASVIVSARAAVAAQIQAKEELALAQAHVTATAATLRHSQANAGITATHASAASAATAHAAATTRLAAAQASVLTVGRGLLALLGGPVGIISLVATAAAGFFLFRDNANEAKQSMLDLTQPADQLIKKFRELSDSQRGAQIIITAKLADDAEKVAQESFNKILHAIRPRDTGLSVDIWRQLRDQFEAAAKSGQDLAPIIEDIRTRALLPDSVIQKLVLLSGEYSTSAISAEAARAKTEALKNEQNALTQSAINAANAQSGLNATFNDGQTDEYLKRLKDRNNGLKDGNSAVKAAKRYLSELNDVSEERKTQILAEAASIDKLSQVKKTATKTETEAQKAAKERASEEEKNLKILKDLAQELGNVALSGEELAVAKAKSSLNKFATQEEIALAEQLAAATWKATEAKDAATRNKSLLNSVDPVVGAQSQFETEMTNLKALNEAKLLEDQRYLELKSQAETAHATNMAMLQEQNFRKQSEWNNMLMSSIDQVGQAGASALTGLITGASNGEEAMRALANAILGEVVGSFVKMGIAQVKAWVMGQTAKAAAGAAYVAAVTGQVAANTALAAQAAFASTAAIPIVGPALAPGVAAAAGVAAGALGAPAIAGASASLAGGRQYGGSVAAGSMYRINETGAPEIFNAANGQQYMLPNRRGEVVSNKEASKSEGGSSGVIINVIENQQRGGEMERSMIGDTEQVNIFVSDIRSGGKMSKAMEQTYGLNRRGT